MIELGVNIDHVASIRQARRTHEPDPVWAAVEAHLGGADGITIHLREDRRHILDADIHALRSVVKTRFNLEMANVPEIVDLAVRVRPDIVCLVPERREEVTTEGGLDVVGNAAALEECRRRLNGAGIDVSLSSRRMPPRWRPRPGLGRSSSSCTPAPTPTRSTPSGSGTSRSNASWPRRTSPTAWDSTSTPATA